MNKFVICCPAYKQILTESEVLNLRITQENNPNISKVFIIPKTISKEFYINNFPSWEIVEMESFYFKSVSTYNKLLLSNVLYKIFYKYKFILICQFDALLVKNIYYIPDCYDFIGAPWQKKVNYRGFELEIGNGGLSLRRVKKFYFLTTLLWFLKMSNANEDVIFSFLGKIKILKIPNFKIANNIFKETTSVGMTNTNNTYGFHALEKWNLNLQNILHNKFNH
jgi:hypothetical protein